MPKTEKSAPKFAPAPSEMIQLFERAIHALPDTEIRKMFGYPAAFVNGIMFSGLFGSDMMLRLSPDNLKTFLILSGARPFEPMPGRPMREYAVIPESVLHSEPELAAWLRKAHDYATTIPPKPPQKKKKG